MTAAAGQATLIPPDERTPASRIAIIDPPHNLPDDDFAGRARAATVQGEVLSEAETPAPDLGGLEAPPPPKPKEVPVDDTPPTRVVAKSHALSILATLAVLYTLYLARSVLLPIVFAVVLSLLLRPAVRWLARRRVPEFVGAAACLLALCLATGFSVMQVVGPAQKWAASLPQKLTLAELKLRGVLSQVRELSAAQDKIEEIANGGDTVKPLEVQVAQPRLAGNAVLLSTTGAMVGAVVVVLVLTFFLLTAGDLLISNVLSTLSTLSEKRQVVELIQNVQKGVSSYLFTVTVINAGLALVVWFAMWAIGVPNPALWGLLAGVLNFVPYIGPLVCALIIAFVSLLSFDSFAHATVAPLTFIIITAIEGNLITPVFVGRQMSLNPIMVFLFLIFWGWMWGVGGAILAVPILAISRITCDQFERTRPLGTMLGA